jgi:hypothetical protein
VDGEDVVVAVAIVVVEADEGDETIALEPLVQKTVELLPLLPGAKSPLTKSIVYGNVNLMFDSCET